VTGTAVVFALAAGACVLVILVEHAWDRWVRPDQRRGRKPPSRRGLVGS
jgi:hypothetical protein